MQYICNTYLSETFHVKHFVNTDTELQPIMVKKKEKSPRPLRSWWWFNHEEHKDADFFVTLSRHCVHVRIGYTIIELLYIIDMNKVGYLYLFLISILLLAYPVYTLIIESRWASLYLIIGLVISASVGLYRMFKRKV